MSGHPILELLMLTAPKPALRTTLPTAATVSRLALFRRLRIRGSRHSLEKERAWSEQPAGRTTSAMARRAATLPAASRLRPLARIQRRAARQPPNSAAAPSPRLSSPLLAPQPALLLAASQTCGTPWPTSSRGSARRSARLTTCSVTAPSASRPPARQPPPPPLAPPHTPTLLSRPARPRSPVIPPRPPVAPLTDFAGTLA